MKRILIAGIILASCTQIATCYNFHGHHPHDHHPECSSNAHHLNDDNPTQPPPPEPKPEPKGCLNNGFGRGSGDCDAPGNSEDHNNAENSGGNN